MLALSLAVLLSFIPMWVYAYIIYWLDRFEREPIKLLILVFFWGAFVATIGAAIAEFIFGAGLFSITGNQTLTDVANDALFAPFIEESLKGIAILVVAFVFRSEFDSVLDGIVYAAVVALGFAATEDVFYLFSGYQDQGWSYFFALFVVRVVMTGWNHAVFTAFTGIGIALARLNTNIFVKILAPIGGWACAVILHGTFNALLSTASGAGVILAFCLSWLSWIAMFALIIWAIRIERARNRTYLADEVTLGTISAAQYRAACTALAPTFTRLAALGSGHYWDTRRFFQVCGELAQKKEQLARFGDERGNAKKVRELRAELGKLAAVART